MKRSITLLLLSWVLTVMSATAQVNFSEHIAEIIYEKCTSCHRPGEIAPFPLTNYEEVVAWSNMIQYVTEIKYMPPWKPDRDFSNFVGESGLTDEEIQLIADWVNAGSPEGDPNLAPSVPNFPSGSQLGTPDLVLEMTEDYFIEGNNQDDYRVFVLPTGLMEDKEIAAVEFRPGNNKAVHHALIAYETNGAAAALDAQSSGYGYESFGDFGVPVQGNFTGYTPGIRTVAFPPGIGTLLPAGADLLIQVHYAPLATNETDRSSLNIFFKEDSDPIQREVERMPVTPLHLDGGWSSFSIPPNEVKSFHGTRSVPEDVSLINVYPHSHYLGKDWEIFALSPTDDTINIIRIEEWDFNWQGAYTFNRMKKIPAGSVIHVNATYDNTASNPFNPSSPPQTVTWGEGTKDEMYLVGINGVPYQEGDEDIVIGGGISTSVENTIHTSGHQLLAPFPNPSDGEVLLRYYLNSPEKVSIDLVDIKGALAKSILRQIPVPSGAHQLAISVQDLPSGVYSIRLSSGGVVLSQPLVISK
ncbi:MAG: T9SS type A sorting domain-containing protein [Bacteroidota bacterium]